MPSVLFPLEKTSELLTVSTRRIRLATNQTVSFLKDRVQLYRKPSLVSWLSPPLHALRRNFKHQNPGELTRFCVVVFLNHVSSPTLRPIPTRCAVRLFVPWNI